MPEQDLPFETYLETLVSKTSGEPAAKKRKARDPALGAEIVKFLDFYDEMARVSLQPLTAAEKSLVERLVQESVSGPAPADKDAKAINKLLLHLMMTADEESEDTAMPVFLLGMAYERLRTKLTLLPKES